MTNIAASHSEEVAKARELMKKSHQVSPDWPLSGKSSRRIEDERDAFKNTPR